jgi:SdpI/YhfL family protein
LGKVPMNNAYGIRFKKSFESEELWYKINAYGGKLLIIWSIPLVFLGVATFFMPIEGRRIWITLVACAPLIAVVPAVMSYIYSRNL